MPLRRNGMPGDRGQPVADLREGLQRAGDDRRTPGALPRHRARQRRQPAQPRPGGARWVPAGLSRGGGRHPRRGHRRHSLRAPREMLRIVPASLDADTLMIGAAELAFGPLLADPAALYHQGVHGDRTGGRDDHRVGLDRLRRRPSCVPTARIRRSHRRGHRRRTRVHRASRPAGAACAVRSPCGGRRRRTPAGTPVPGRRATPPGSRRRRPPPADRTCRRGRRPPTPRHPWQPSVAPSPTVPGGEPGPRTPRAPRRRRPGRVPPRPRRSCARRQRSSALRDSRPRRRQPRPGSRHTRQTGLMQPFSRFVHRNIWWPQAAS